jgi:cytochrome bd-type quinol oxidase subunit 2
MLWLLESSAYPSNLFSGSTMKLKQKIAFKIVLTYIIIFILFETCMSFLNLSEIIFDSFLFRYPELVSLSTFLFGGLMSFLGYILSKRKNKDKKKWAILCFIFNIWALIILYFLPSEEKSNKV